MVDVLLNKKQIITLATLYALEDMGYSVDKIIDFYIEYIKFKEETS